MVTGFTGIFSHGVKRGKNRGSAFTLFYKVIFTKKVIEKHNIIVGKKSNSVEQEVKADGKTKGRKGKTDLRTTENGLQGRTDSTSTDKSLGEGRVGQHELAGVQGLSGQQLKKKEQDLIRNL